MQDGIGSISNLARHSYPAWLFFGGIIFIFAGNASTGEILLILGGVLGFVHWLPNLIIRYKKAIREPTTEREIEGDDAVPDDSEIRNRETPDYSEEIRREIYKK